MSDLSFGALIGALVVLIAASAFFSGAETGLMALNRYRLRHLARVHPGAKRARRLLEEPDRVIGLIVLGNNFVNILASSLATWALLTLFREAGIVIATAVLTAVIVIFAEVAPKTAAALNPERFAFPAARVLGPLLWPRVPRGAGPQLAGQRRAAHGACIPRRPRRGAAERRRAPYRGARSGLRMSERYQSMLVGLLDLAKVTVDHVMVPRSEIAGLDLDEDEKRLMETILASPRTQLPIYRGDVNAVEGVVHLRRMIGPIARGEFSREGSWRRRRASPTSPPSEPRSTRSYGAFQSRQERMALVVDEYGDVQGLITPADILEEVVGEFTTAAAAMTGRRAPAGGRHLPGGRRISVRDLDRALGSSLADDDPLGPKTLNGLILEHLESIRSHGTSVLISGYPVEIMQTMEHAVKTARIDPRRRPPPPAPPE